MSHPYAELAQLLKDACDELKVTPSGAGEAVDEHAGLYGMVLANALLDRSKRERQAEPQS